MVTGGQLVKLDIAENGSNLLTGTLQNLQASADAQPTRSDGQQQNSHERKHHLLQLQPAATTSTSSTLTNTKGPSRLVNVATAAPKLGTYHNRNFVQAEAGVQSSVFLVPTVQSDGSVAYAFHHSNQVKIVSPLKGCQSIIPLVQMPPTTNGREAVKIRPAHKARPPAKILPKGTAPQHATPRLVSAGKVIRLSADPQEKTCGGVPLLMAKPIMATLASKNSSFAEGFSGETAHGIAHCSGNKIFCGCMGSYCSHRSFDSPGVKKRDHGKDRLISWHISLFFFSFLPPAPNLTM
jgi:hypothetical protein